MGGKDGGREGPAGGLDVTFGCGADHLLFEPYNRNYCSPPHFPLFPLQSTFSFSSSFFSFLFTPPPPGGGWCSSLEDCALRTLGPLGSSSDYKSTTPLLLGRGGGRKGDQGGKEGKRGVGYVWKGGTEEERIANVCVYELTFIFFHPKLQAS